jgi:amino acid adenylation domain-containing protein
MIDIGRRAASEAERRAIAAWNATRHHVDTRCCVPQLVAMQAATAPEAPALGGPAGVLSHGDLHARATALAGRLAALGIGRNALVAVVVPRSPDLVVAALGAFYAGAAYLPLEPSSPRERLRFVLDDATPAAVLVGSGSAVDVPDGPWAVVPVECAASDGDAGLVPPAVSDAEDLAYVIYTSGSTGRPKGVEITHAALLNLVTWHCRAFAVVPGDRAMQYASPGFDAAVWEIWPYLTAGASLHFPQDALRHDPERLRDWMVREAITIGFLPTPVAERAVALDWPPGTALTRLLTGGDTLHGYARPGLPFTLVNNYGPTETTVVATSGVVPWALGDGAALPSIGRPIDNTEIHVLDEGLEPVPPGEVGELYIGGAGLARGYRHRPDLTAERFVPDPFRAEPGARLYRTGDLGRFLPDGRLAFLGRADEQIKVRGFRVEAGEVVAALNALPEIATSAVDARNDGRGTHALVAWVVPAAGAALNAVALRTALAATLPDYMLPSRFVAVEALPLTVNGKVDRQALPAPDDANTVRDGVLVAPRSPIEEQLAAMVGGLLNGAAVGATDNFFLAGGHSLLGSQLVARIRDAFEVDVPLRAVFEHPTVEALAAEVERAILDAIEDGGAAPLETAA